MPYNFEKVITVNIGNYESVKLGVSADSFQACDIELDKELVRLGLKSCVVRLPEVKA